MDACRLQGYLRCGSFIFLLSVTGCGRVQSGTSTDGPQKPEHSASGFHASLGGMIRGRVTWDGEMPQIADYQIAPNLIGSEVFHRRQIRPNPNAPVIDPRSRGVADAVVFLRGVDPGQSKPWDHPAVMVEQRGCQYYVRQGEAPSRVGFVQRGDRVQIVSRDRYLHVARAGGAEFFSLTFPDPEQPLERVLSHDGVVELTSGAGYYWMRAYLFVTDHPYCTRTDKDGRFELTQVPPGHYDVVCWQANWLERSHDRDPESRLICRLYFQPPVEKTMTLNLAPGESSDAHFGVSATDFRPAKRP